MGAVKVRRSVSLKIGISLGAGRGGRSPSCSFGISRSSKAAKSSPALSAPRCISNLKSDY